MSQENVNEKVKALVAEQLGVPIDRVVPEAKIVDDLGADSLDTVELVMALEETFNVEIPDEDAEKILSIQDVYDYISKNYETAG